MSTYDPDAQPFELALSNLPKFGDDIERHALVEVSDDIDFAKRILLQHKVKSFTAADVIVVAQMIQARRDLLQGARRKETS